MGDELDDVVEGRQASHDLDAHERQNREDQQEEQEQRRQVQRLIGAQSGPSLADADLAQPPRSIFEGVAQEPKPAHETVATKFMSVRS